eukprot:snap_masked-scaffold_29-processed-gene-3.6-mRNA-1 protein AED:0.33 eAED:0.33 QI:0/-1/0/1/-1/1/1/0/173
MERKDEAKLANLRQSFANFDSNNNGFIDKNELKELLKSFNLEFTEERFEELFLKLDTDKNGQVDFKEFCFIFDEIEQGLDHKIVEAFNAFDKDGNGTIDVSEMKGVFQRLGIDASEQEVKDVMKLVDDNDDGEIDLGEFTKSYMELNIKNAVENNPDLLKPEPETSSGCCVIC